jgi:hypothetical protein
MTQKLRQAAGVVTVLALVAGAAFAVDALLLSGDEGRSRATTVDAEVLAPGTFVSAHPFAPYYVVPRRRIADPSKLSRAARNRFVTKPESALEKGATAASPQIVRLRLRSASEEPVIVKAIWAQVVDSGRPVRGGFTASPGCAFEGAQVARLALDARHPRSTYVDASGRSSRTLALKLDRIDGEIVELQATTRRRRVDWTVELRVRTANGTPKSIAVDDGGKPFRVTAASASRGYAPIFGATGIRGFARERPWDGGITKAC